MRDRTVESPSPCIALLALVALGVPPNAASQEATESCASPECCEAAEGAELHGEVLTAESGAPIPAATVEFHLTSPPNAGQASPHRVQTDDSGAYRLCGIPVPAQVEARAEKSGATSQTLNFRLDAARPVELTFEIRGVPVGLDSLKKAAAASRAEAEPGRITGRIEDTETGRPVTEATVKLEPGGRTALTDGRGKFAIPEAPAGQGKLTIHHVAYGDQTVEVNVPSELTVNLDIELPPKAVELEPIDVRVEATIRNRHLEDEGFYRRMEKDFGHFWTPERLERRKPARVSHVLKQTPGVGLLRQCGGVCRYYPYLHNSTPRFSADGDLYTCRATVYLDGRKAPLDAFTGIDELVPASSLAAIEVYRGAAGTAPEFIDSDSRCGVVVLWTKRGPGPPEDGQP